MCEVEVSAVSLQNKKNSTNIIALSGILKDATAIFRRAVVEALAKEGFELDETLPNLQLACETLDAIGWLESRGHGHQWSRFEEALRAADREGILLDLGAFGHGVRLLEPTE